MASSFRRFRDVSNSTDSNGWGLQLRQSVFSWQNWVALRSANHFVAQAEADYIVAQQSLAQRVTQQYFAVLAAVDNVEAFEAAREAISRQLDQVERRFEVGLIAITDVQESRAGRDQAAAAVIEAKRALASQLEAAAHHHWRQAGSTHQARRRHAPAQRRPPPTRKTGCAFPWNRTPR